MVDQLFQPTLNLVEMAEKQWVASTDLLAGNDFQVLCHFPANFLFKTLLEMLVWVSGT